MKCPICNRADRPKLLKYGMCIVCYMKSKEKTADLQRERKAQSKPKKKSVQREGKLQESCVKWFYLMFDSERNWLFSIPNGGSRHKLEAFRLKREGVRAGVADLCLLKPNAEFHALFIELKYKNTNNQSKAQIEFQKYCNDNGYCYKVVRTLDEFMLTIKKYFYGTSSDK